MDGGITMHLISVFSILIFKLSVLLVGFLIAKLGYDLLIKGVTGEFQFKSSISGIKADLVSVSPGLFFIFLGTILIFTAITKDKPISTSIDTNLKGNTPKINQKDSFQYNKPVLPMKPIFLGKEDRGRK